MATLIERVFSGSDEMYEKAEKALAEAAAKYDDSTPVAYPDTAYYLECLYSMTGRKNQTLGELKESMKWIKEQMTREKRTHDVFTSGVATACAAEVIEAVKYIGGVNPYEGTSYKGHMSDADVRELGVPLVTGDIPGFVLFIGAAPSDAKAAELIKSYQAKSIYVFLVGEIIHQAERAGVNMGHAVRIFPVGPDVHDATHVISVAVRVALIFGGIEPGNYDGIRKYTFERVNACVNAFEPVSDLTVACGGGAISYGFPVITNDDNDMWRIPKSLIVQPDVDKFVETSIEARGLKIKVTNVDIPVAYANAFEGEIIRKADMFAEANGTTHDCFELVRSIDASQVTDHKIEVVGNDIDVREEKNQICLGFVVDVCGKKMQPDFEPVFERKFHAWINCIEGVMHTGQRDLIRIRISNATAEAGFRAAHFGEVLYAKIKSEFESVVDKCQVTVYTDPAKCKEMRAEANKIYDKRDDRLVSLTDETVDEFYSCIMCQAFSPSHVCIVTPERLGLCGAVSWLDAKATYQLDNNGPCKIVTKGGLIDENVGRWEDVDEVVHSLSQGALEHVTLYSIMEDPMTSCGCFECICGIEPISNGVVIVNREHVAMTPLGMTFSEMASMTGGGVQTPGFMGHGKHFIASKKFMKAEGGVARIVWMPKALKDIVAEKLNKTAKELYGIDNFVDMIGDETVTEDATELYDYLTQKNHPVLGLEPLM